MSAEGCSLVRVVRYLMMLVLVAVCGATVVLSARARHACAMQHHIPYWNIVSCVLVVLVIVHKVLEDVGLAEWCTHHIFTPQIKKLHKNTKNELQIFLDHGRGFIYVTLFIWFIPGIAWIFTNIQHFINSVVKKKEKFQCDLATYILGLVIIVLALVVTVFKCVTKFLHSRRKWEDRMCGSKSSKNPLPDKYTVQVPHLDTDENTEAVVVG